MRSLRAGVLAAFLVVGISACSGDDSSDTTTTSEARTTTTNAELSAYCTAAQAYVDALEVDTETVAETIDGLQAAAAAARALADAAPEDVKDAHDRIATSAEALVAGIIQLDPKDEEDLGEAGTIVSEEVIGQYGALDEQVAAFSLFAKAECGLELGPGDETPADA